MSPVNGHVRVLLVDDSDVFRAVLRSLVEATAGFAVIGEADSGEVALDRVAGLDPDLLVMDCRMEPLDGIAATRLIVDRHPGVEVVLVSADWVDEHEFGGCGALAFVPKQELSSRRLREIWACRP
jgi:DNA-binding NarL/FixJ family response regulator